MADDRVVVRCYNEEKDRFEKVCSTRKYQLITDSFLEADGRYYYCFHGRLYHLGSARCVLRRVGDIGDLLMLDASNCLLPFRALFLETNSMDCTEAESYELAEDSVTVTTPGGQKYVFQYVAGEPDFDCHVDYYLQKIML